MLEVLEQFRVIIRSVRRHYQAVERRAGLSGAQLWALAEEGSTASNLARRLHTLGHVSRERRGRDQRHVQLFTTAKGQKTLERAPRPSIGVLQQALSDLPAADLRRLQRDLSRVVRLMKVRSVAAARALPLSDLR